jgi:hypothetical protein
MLRHISAFNEELQAVLLSQFGHELLIRVGLGGAQLVVEMNNGEDNAQIGTQLQQQAQQRHRIHPARNRNPTAVASPQEFLSPDMPQRAFRQFMHGTIVHRQG